MIIDAEFQESNEVINADFGVVKFAGEKPLHVDQTYNPESENAQSGKAVAEAVSNVKIYVDKAIGEALESDY